MSHVPLQSLQIQPDAVDPLLAQQQTRFNTVVRDVALWRCTRRLEGEDCALPGKPSSLFVESCTAGSRAPFTRTENPMRNSATTRRRSLQRANRAYAEGNLQHYVSVLQDQLVDLQSETGRLEADFRAAVGVAPGSGLQPRKADRLVSSENPEVAQ